MGSTPQSTKGPHPGPTPVGLFPSSRSRRHLPPVITPQPASTSTSQRFTTIGNRRIPRPVIRPPLKSKYRPAQREALEMATAGLIDPTQTGNFPVILGDALLGEPSNEIFTGIRYNHKPSLSSSSAPNSARLKPSVPGKTSSYDLNYTDGDDKYSFSGARNTGGGQYVLYFDPERQAFILDKVDSTFNMNVTRLPDNSDPDSLRQDYPHIEDALPTPAAAAAPRKAPKVKVTDTDKPATKPVAKPAAKSTAKSAARSAAKPSAKPAAKAPQKKEVKRKQEKKQAPPKNIALSLPVPEPPKPKPMPEPKPRHPMEEDEDEDEDDDGGLLVEYPDGDPRTKRHTDFSPAFPAVRKFDDFMDQRESEGDDADGEEDDEPDIEFMLPSPVNHHRQPPEPMEEDEEEDDVIDLEDELEKAFEDFENSQQGSPDGDESEISEED